MAAVSVTPATGTAKMTVVRVDVSGLPDTAFDQYNPAAVPAEPPILYYIEASNGGRRYLKSHVFTPAQDGTHTWNNVCLPDIGTWAFAVATVSGDVTVASAAYEAAGE